MLCYLKFRGHTAETPDEEKRLFFLPAGFLFGALAPMASPAKWVGMGKEDSPRGGEMSAKPTERGRSSVVNEPCRLCGQGERYAAAFDAKKARRLTRNPVRGIELKAPTPVLRSFPMNTKKGFVYSLTPCAEIRAGRFVFPDDRFVFVL